MNFNTAKEQFCCSHVALCCLHVVLLHFMLPVKSLILSIRFSPLFTAVPNTWKEQPPKVSCIVDAKVDVKKGVAIPRNVLEALWDSIAEPTHTAEEVILTCKKLWIYKR
jgi:hypothetical protein